MHPDNARYSAKSDIGRRCGPRGSLRSVAAEEVRPEIG
jgi:hypothetical protein